MSKLPFSLMPGSWGLKGKTRQIAKAEYELTGYELSIALLNINKADFDKSTYDKKLLDIELQFEKISRKEYNRELVELITDVKQRAIATLELDKDDNKISDIEYEKQLATLNNEPWVSVIKLDLNVSKSKEGSFELDWNDLFVENLSKEGYVGHTPDDIINQWFIELCRNVAMEEFDGTGDFTADSEANMEALKRWNSSSDVSGTRRSHT